MHHTYASWSEMHDATHFGAALDWFAIQASKRVKQAAFCWENTCVTTHARYEWLVRSAVRVGSAQWRVGAPLLHPRPSVTTSWLSCMRLGGWEPDPN